MKEEEYSMGEKTNDHVVRELRNILADFKNMIEKETVSYKQIGLLQSSSQRIRIK